MLIKHCIPLISWLNNLLNNPTKGTSIVCKGNQLDVFICFCNLFILFTRQI